MLSFVLLSLGLSVLFFALLVSLALSLSRARIELPSSEPSRLLSSGKRRDTKRPLCICAGDSITHGVISANYVDMLATRLPDWDFSNAGINSELAYNLAERLDPIIALEPAAVTILIGTNDVNSTFGLRSALGYYALHRFPERPNLLFFRENLTLVVRRLKKESGARIALLSIPPLGEDPQHYAWLRTEEYSAVICEVAKTEGLDYLPLRERLVAYLEAVPPGHALPFQKFGSAQNRAGRAHLLFGKSLDEISAANGFHLLVDGIHLNTHGAAIIADLIEAFLRSLRK